MNQLVQKKMSWPNSFKKKNKNKKKQNKGKQWIDICLFDSKFRTLLSESESLSGAGPKENSTIPSQLQERLSEAAFLRDSLPEQIAARGAYLEEQLQWRSQLNQAQRRLNSWLDEAKLRLRPSSNGVDFEHVSTELNEHVVNICCFVLLFYGLLSTRIVWAEWDESISMNDAGLFQRWCITSSATGEHSLGS